MEGLDQVNFQQPVWICETIRNDKQQFFQVCCFYLNIFFFPIRSFLKKTRLSPKFNKEKKNSQAHQARPFLFFIKWKKVFFFFLLWTDKECFLERICDWGLFFVLGDGRKTWLFGKIIEVSMLFFLLKILWYNPKKQNKKSSKLLFVILKKFLWPLFVFFFCFCFVLCNFVLSSWGRWVTFFPGMSNRRFTTTESFGSRRCRDWFKHGVSCCLFSFFFLMSNHQLFLVFSFSIILKRFFCITPRQKQIKFVTCGRNKPFGLFRIIFQNKMMSF